MTVGWIGRFLEVAGQEGFGQAFGRGRKALDARIRKRVDMVGSWVEGRVLESDRGFLRRVKFEARTVESLLSHLSKKKSRAFPFPEEERTRFLHVLQTEFPEEASRILPEADSICRHQLSMLGQRFSFPDRPMDWNAGPPGSGPWPREHVTKIRTWLWTDKRGRDWLPVWELNRHQFFSTLGKAYWLTGDERYVREVCDQIESWIDQNPWQTGINWFSPMEICLRLISWANAFFMFRESPLFLERCGRTFIKSLYQQTHFVRTHLTLNNRNNHIISEAVGLVTIGSLFPEFADSEDWVETGFAIAEREAALQTSSDGVNKEQATGYHHYVLDLLLWLVVLGRRGVCRRSEILERVVERMLDYVLYSLQPDGRLPQVGDTNDGWGFRYNGRTDYWDLRPWLAVGAVLFGRPEFKFASGGFSEEPLWLLGEEGLRAFREMDARPPKSISHAFYQGGHFFLRDDWTRESDYLMIRAGEFGLGGEGFCAHAHCDLLSLVLWIEGNRVIVDSGTYTYDGPWRDWFRLTAAHNTLHVDGKEQAVPQRDFFWNEVPRAECEHFDGKTVATRLRIHGVSICREVRHGSRGLWQITDTIDGTGPHRIDWTFNFAPELAVKLGGPRATVVVERNGEPFLFLTPAADVELRLIRGWFSEGYGTKVSIPRLEATWNGRFAVDGVRFEWSLESARVFQRSPGYREEVAASQGQDV